MAVGSCPHKGGEQVGFAYVRRGCMGWWGAQSEAGCAVGKGWVRVMAHRPLRSTDNFKGAVSEAVGKTHQVS